MAYWRLMVAHHLAHLEPTFVSTAVVGGYPKGNIRTLDPDARARMTGATIELTWDRGALGNHQAIDGAFFGGCSYDRARAIQLLAADNSGFTLPVTLLSAGTHLMNIKVPHARLFAASSSLRYLQLQLIRIASETAEIGTFSAGKLYGLGDALFPGYEDNAEPGGLIRVRRRFDNVADATALEIMQRYAADQILDTASAGWDGWGCLGGDEMRPIVLAKFSSSTAAASDEAYYGRGEISLTKGYEGFSTLDITVHHRPVGPILVI